MSSGFRPLKRVPAIYVNNGHSSFSVQQDKGAPPDPQLQKALIAAATAFWEVYRPKGKPSMALRPQKAE